MLCTLFTLSFFSCSDEDIVKKETPPVVIDGVDKSKQQIYLCFGQSNMEGNAAINK